MACCRCEILQVRVCFLCCRYVFFIITQPWTLTRCSQYLITCRLCYNVTLAWDGLLFLCTFTQLSWMWFDCGLITLTMGGTLHESKRKFVCVCGGAGGFKTTRTSVKDTAGAAESGTGKVFSFFSVSLFFFFYRAIKEPWTHIDKLPPTELVSCSALASREVKWISIGRLCGQPSAGRPQRGRNQ